MYINNTFTHAFEGIHVKNSGLENLKGLLKKKEKVVLIPVYKSFLDLSVILYTLYLNGIDFPFSIGNGDDVPTVAFMDSIFCNSGYVPARRTR